MDSAGRYSQVTNTAGSSASSSNLTTPPRKKKKRLQKYRVEWEKEQAWLESVHNNSYEAHCTVCRRTFSVAHGGQWDVKQHASSNGHIRNMRDNRTRGTLDQFVLHQATPEADVVYKKNIFLMLCGNVMNMSI
ncbi:hypothetical protein AMECASPLE_033662 [Ameca splendens]|uniref:BED-type domain-containing protein n=1 Tax=Ameca splendens TaxID=208324 RepID=A0ABV0YU32_9TELE